MCEIAVFCISNFLKVHINKGNEFLVLGILIGNLMNHKTFFHLLFFLMMPEVTLSSAPQGMYAKLQ